MAIQCLVWEFGGHEAESGKGAPGYGSFCPWVCGVSGEIKSEGGLAVLLPTLHTRESPSAQHTTIVETETCSEQEAGLGNGGLTP